jgi:hypothetical protein
MPELRNWNVDPEVKKWKDIGFTYISHSTAERLYNDISESHSPNFNGKHLIVLMSKKKMMCSGFVADIDPKTQEEVLRLVCQITFYHPRPVTDILPNDIKNPLQVSTVYTDVDFEGRGVASYLYALVAKNRYTLISDRVQYLGGKLLWVKMTSRAHFNDYIIKIWNEDTGYVKDGEGNDLEYNSKNIDASIIWKPSTIGQKTVMILTAK